MEIEPDEEYHSDTSAVSKVSRLTSKKKNEITSKVYSTFSIKHFVIAIISLVISIVISSKNFNIILIGFQTLIFVVSYILIIMLNKLGVF